MIHPDFILANKQKFHREEALALARACETVIVAKGKKALVFDLKNDVVSDDALAAVILGRSGTLRAPAIRTAGTFLVGFNAEHYAEIFG